MNTTKKILTISVAAYNAEKDLSRCIDSLVLTSVCDKLDIIIVNDGSTDNTFQIASDYCSRYPNSCRIINKKNGGHGSTINASIKEATGKYYKVVDSDDWVDKEGLEKLVAWLETGEVDCVLNPFSTADAKDYSITDTIFPYDKARLPGIVYDIDDSKDIELAMHSITFKTEIVKKMGPVIDENCFYVDMEYVIMSMIYVESYICFDYNVYNYLMGNASQSVNICNMITRRNQHLKVVSRIIDTYESNKLTMKQGKKKLIAKRVKYAALAQYKLYSLMGFDLSRKEIMDYDNYLKNASDELYYDLIGRFFYIIKFSRKTKFAFHALISVILKRCNMLS